MLDNFSYNIRGRLAYNASTSDQIIEESIWWQYSWDLLEVWRLSEIQVTFRRNLLCSPTQFLYCIDALDTSMGSFTFKNARSD